LDTPSYVLQSICIKLTDFEKIMNIITVTIKCIPLKVLLNFVLLPGNVGHAHSV